MGNFATRFTGSAEPAPTSQKQAFRKVESSGESSSSSSSEEAPQQRNDGYQENHFDTQRALAASQDPANDVAENIEDLETAMRVSKLEHTFTAGLGEEDGVNAAIEASLREAERQKRREARKADEKTSRHSPRDSSRRDSARLSADAPAFTPTTISNPPVVLSGRHKTAENATTACGIPFTCNADADSH